jgi:hypothetical protein
MPNPVRQDVHVNALLSNVTVAFMQDDKTFVADKVFPSVSVAKQSDRYAVYNRGDFNRDEMQERAPGTESAGGGYNLDNTPTYYAKVWAFHKDLDDQVRANADDVFNLEKESATYLAHKAMIKREKLFASSFLATSVWTGDQTGVAAAPGANQFLQWNDASSDPILDIRKQMTIIQKRTGLRPNVLVLGQEVYDALMDHPDIIDRIKYGQTPGSIATADTSDLAALFKIPKVLVMGAIVNDGAEGAAESNSFISGKKALLVYAAPSPGLMTPTGGYTFEWSGLMGSVGKGTRVKQFRMEHLSADRIEVEMAFDMKLVATELGVLFASAVA